MAFWSRQSAEVLDFRPRNEHRWAQGGRRDVLWPALAWRVVGPLRSARSLDVFLRATLALCDAGLWRPEEIADRLSLERELAVLLLSQVNAQGLVDGVGRVTTSGRRILAAGAFDPEGVVQGWLLQDPFDGRFWEGLVEQLPFADAAWDGDNCVLQTGSVSDPRVSRPRWIDGSGRDVRLPDAKQILTAARSTAGQTVAAQSTETFSRVALVDTEPRSVFLATWLYVPEDGATSLVARHPRGGDDRRMTRLVESQKESHPELARVIGTLLESAVDESAREGLILRQAAQRVAEEVVARRVGPALNEHSECAAQLSAMERDWREVSMAHDAPKDRAADVLVKAQKAVESICQTTVSRWPGSWEALPENRGALSDILIGYTQALGLSFPGRKWRLLRTWRDKVRSAIESRNESLIPLMAAMLVSARANQDHPLWRAAALDKDIYFKLTNLANARDRLGGHARKDSAASLERKDLLVHVETAYAAVAQLIGAPLVARET